MRKWEEEIDETQIPCHCMSEMVPVSFYDPANIQHFKDFRMTSVSYGLPTKTDRRRIKRGERCGTRGFRVRLPPTLNYLR